MAAKVYVGNLPFTVDADQLRTLFEEGGHEVLDVKIITDRDTGRPRGFGFVEMSSQEDAQAVINSLNGKDMGGRSLTVSMAQERERGGRSPGGGRGPGGGGFGRGGGGGGGGRRDRY